MSEHHVYGVNLSLAAWLYATVLHLDHLMPHVASRTVIGSAISSLASVTHSPRRLVGRRSRVDCYLVVFVSWAAQSLLDSSIVMSSSVPSYGSFSIPNSLSLNFTSDD